MNPVSLIENGGSLTFGWQLVSVFISTKLTQLITEKSQLFQCGPFSAHMIYIMQDQNDLTGRSYKK